MEQFYRDYFDCLQKSHEEIEAVLEGLPQEALDWTPGSGMNSLCVLAVHVAGAEFYLLGDVIAREPSKRDREAEFAARGLSAAVLKGRLAAALDYSRVVLGDLSLQSLTAGRLYPRDGSEVTVGWTLTHLMRHTALHAGHMALTRQFWEQRQAG